MAQAVRSTWQSVPVFGWELGNDYDISLVPFGSTLHACVEQVFCPVIDSFLILWLQEMGCKTFVSHMYPKLNVWSKSKSNQVKLPEISNHVTWHGTATANISRIRSIEVTNHSNISMGVRWLMLRVWWRAAMKSVLQWITALHSPKASKS
jgi:hypothetical protein